MLLYWHAYISMNIYCYEIYHISSKMVWWALSNASSIMWICLAIYEIIANKTFTVTDSLISQLFVVAFVYPTCMDSVICQVYPCWRYISVVTLYPLPLWNKPVFYDSYSFHNISSQKWYNNPDIPSFMIKILLFDLVFYSRVFLTPVSSLLLKLWASPIFLTCI